MKKLFYTLLLFVVSMGLVYPVQAKDAVPSAKEIMDQAYAQAKKENKNVFVIFHASWCGWCKKMDQTMNNERCKALFDANYVVVHLVVLENDANKALENAGAMEMMTKYHGGKSGIPFWLIFNPQGNLIGDSLIRPEGASFDTPGQNVGCPARENEVAHFTQVLKKTSSLNDEQLAVIQKEFLAI